MLFIKCFMDVSVIHGSTKFLEYRRLTWEGSADTNNEKYPTTGDVCSGF